MTRGAHPTRLTACAAALALLLWAAPSEPPVLAQTPAQTAPPPADDTAIRPFRIDVPDAVLADLKARLRNPRIPAPLQGDGWELGTDTAYLRQLVTYWRDSFDWRAQERKLNAMEQFTTTIDGLRVHFVHRKAKPPGAFPLLVTHGWPGSFAEFTKIIGPLTDPVAHGGQAADAFDVVMPSIPGFTFSEAPKAAGYDPARIATIEAALMARLGYARYGAQGGDWGSIISTQVAARDAAHVAGLHLNMCTGAAPAGSDPEAGLTDAEKARLKVRQTFQSEETGYQQIQGTKPQTIGLALNDSPVALAAWIVEKFRTLVRLQRQPRDDLHEGRTAHEHHALLGDADGRVIRAHLLREPASHERAGARAHHGAHGVRGLPQGDHLVAAALARDALQRDALDRDAARRALRRHGAAATAGR